MRPRAIQLAMCCLSLVLLSGCQTRPGYTYRDVQPLYNQDGQARSLTLSTLPVHAIKVSSRNQDRWYEGRRDLGPFVTSGYNSVHHEQTVTYTRDHQHIRNGRVYDYYNQTTYRRTTSEAAR